VKTRNNMKGAIMSRMLMALGVVAALGIFSTEVTAAVVPPVPRAGASDPVVIVPGYACKEAAPSGNLTFTNNSVSVAAAGAPTPIHCPLSYVAGSATAKVAVSGALTLPCLVVSANGAAVSTGVVSGIGGSDVAVPPDASLSLECPVFGNLAPDVITAIKVKT
jgi:hypothetical protein